MNTRCHSTTNRRARRVSVAFGLAVVAAVFLGAGDPPKPRVLFDGKTLDGWKPTAYRHAGKVVVADGSIVLETGNAMTGLTSTRTDLPKTNYELVYEAQRLEGNDFFAAATFPVGESFLTLVNGGWGGSLTGLSSLNGADASENETGRSFEYKNKTWYRFRIRVTDRVVRCWIGDEMVVDLDHEDRQKSTRIETRPCQPLGFATWESAGAIRKVEVRVLTAAEVAATKPTEK